MPADKTKRTVGVALVSVLVLGVLLAVNHRTFSATGKASDKVQAKASRVMQPLQSIVPTNITSTLTWTYDTFINLNKDCATFTDLMFDQTVLQSMQWDGVTNDVYVSGISCGSMTVYYRCGAKDIATATANCLLLKIALQTKASSLNTILLVTLPATFNPDGTSNNAIFALYTLIALPIFCCGGFLIWYRMKQSQADSQYLQDTATFSNTAARAPYDPAAVPPPMTYQPAPQYVQPMQYQPTQPFPQYDITPQQSVQPMYAQAVAPQQFVQPASLYPQQPLDTMPQYNVDPNKVVSQFGAPVPMGYAQ